MELVCIYNIFYYLHGRKEERKSTYTHHTLAEESGGVGRVGGHRVVGRSLGRLSLEGSEAVMPCVCVLSAERDEDGSVAGRMKCRQERGPRGTLEEKIRPMGWVGLMMDVMYIANFCA